MDIKHILKSILNSVLPSSTLPFAQEEIDAAIQDKGGSYGKYRHKADEPHKFRAVVCDSVVEAVQWMHSFSPEIFQEARFTGRRITSWKQVEEMIRSPWPEGLATIEKLKKEITENLEVKPPKSRARKRVWDEEEGEVDVDRALEGHAKPFRHRKREDADDMNPNIAIVVDMACSSYITADEAFYRGAIAAIMTDVWEEAGFSVELWATMCAQNTHPREPQRPNTLFACRAKASGDPLDMLTIANAVSAWFYRSVGFGAIQALEGYSMGYGQPGQLSDKILAHHMGLKDEQVVTVLVPQVYNRTEAVKASKALLGGNDYDDETIIIEGIDFGNM